MTGSRVSRPDAAALHLACNVTRDTRARGAMISFDPKQLAEKVAALPDDTRDLMAAVLEFQESRGMSSLELAGHVRRLVQLFESVLGEKRASRCEAAESEG